MSSFAPVFGPGIAISLIGVSSDVNSLRTGHSFLDVRHCSTTTNCPIYKFDSSIDSATQGLLTASLAARWNQLLLCCDTRHVGAGSTLCVVR
jgi:hypothetical protein